MAFTFLGIDPGVGGGVACLNHDGTMRWAVPMPETDTELLLTLMSARGNQPSLCRGVLEKVHSSPQMGVTSAFTFGTQYGRCRMALSALHIPFDEVSPQRWQRRLECLSGGDKHVTKVRAQQLFVGVKITNAIADACLLAEYARRTQGTPPMEPSTEFVP